MYLAVIISNKFLSCFLLNNVKKFLWSDYTKLNFWALAQSAMFSRNPSLLILRHTILVVKPGGGSNLLQGCLLCTGLGNGLGGGLGSAFLFNFVYIKRQKMKQNSNRGSATEVALV